MHCVNVLLCLCTENKSDYMYKLSRLFRAAPALALRRARLLGRSTVITWREFVSSSKIFRTATLRTATLRTATLRTAGITHSTNGIERHAGPLERDEEPLTGGEGRGAPHWWRGTRSPSLVERDEDPLTGGEGRGPPHWWWWWHRRPHRRILRTNAYLLAAMRLSSARSMFEAEHPAGFVVPLYRPQMCLR